MHFPRTHQTHRRNSSLSIKHFFSISNLMIRLTQVQVPQTVLFDHQKSKLSSTQAISQVLCQRQRDSSIQEVLQHDFFGQLAEPIATVHYTCLHYTPRALRELHTLNLAQIYIENDDMCQNEPNSYELSKKRDNNACIIGRTVTQCKLAVLCVQ